MLANVHTRQQLLSMWYHQSLSQVADLPVQRCCCAVVQLQILVNDLAGAAVSWNACRQMTHTLFEQQGGKGVSLDRFRQFLARLQDGMLKLEYAHYDWQGERSQQQTATLRLVGGSHVDIVIEATGCILSCGGGEGG
jgi:hypothetical protein